MLFRSEFLNQIEEALKSKLTDGRWEFTLDYNDHKSSYHTLQEEFLGKPINVAEWHDMEDRHQAITNNAVWMYCASGDQNMTVERRYASTLFKLLSFFGEFDEKEVYELEGYLISLLSGEHSNFGFQYNPHKGTASKFVNNKWVEYQPTMDEWFGFTDAEYEKAETVEAKADLADFSSVEEYQKALAEDTLWRFQCYPHTPVGFYVNSAATLTNLINETE